jgi:multimeric flavodoxin WrbA
MKKILAINGSYRQDGVTDQYMEAFAQAAEKVGAKVEIIALRDYPIEFCLNCRACTQMPGKSPGECVLQDGMAHLIEKIESADGYILASPTNFYSATALFKRFMERLVVYAYWPWGMNAPQHRKAGAAKKQAVIVSSCAAPGILGRYLFGTLKQLKVTAKTIGADVVGSIFTGLVSKENHPILSERLKKTVPNLLSKLVQP